ncbi:MULTISPECIES: hypothetical protein [Pseudomonas]|uniref:hypothetical protein n=1 Tax=Pseudomonadaceae TaxID=135621 RepID=UPI0011130079|nr:MULTISPECIES: hypothetical protein [Pseudomonas]
MLRLARCRLQVFEERNENALALFRFDVQPEIAQGLAFPVPGVQDAAEVSAALGLRLVLLGEPFLLLIVINAVDDQALGGRVVLADNLDDEAWRLAGCAFTGGKYTAHG